MLLRFADLHVLHIAEQERMSEGSRHVSGQKNKDLLLHCGLCLTIHGVVLALYWNFCEAAICSDVRNRWRIYEVVVYLGAQDCLNKLGAVDDDVYCEHCCPVPQPKVAIRLLIARWLEFGGKQGELGKSEWTILCMNLAL